MTASQLSEQREALVRHHMEVEARGDIESVIATFTRPKYDIIATNTLFDGPTRVRERIQQLAAATPECSIEVVRLHHAEDAVIVETRTRGVHTAPLFGIAATGRSYDIRGVAIFRFEGVDLVEEAVYYDRLTIIDQINASK
jgi:steroid delta-isomerase-like uncharacterized protein